MIEPIMLTLDPDVPDITPQEIIEFQQECLNKMRDKIKELEEENDDLEHQNTILRQEKYFAKNKIGYVIYNGLNSYNEGYFIYLDEDHHIHIRFLTTTDYYTDVDLQEYIDCSIKPGTVIPRE